MSVAWPVAQSHHAFSGVRRVVLCLAPLNRCLSLSPLLSLFSPPVCATAATDSTEGPCAAPNVQPHKQHDTSTRCTAQLLPPAKLEQMEGRRFASVNLLHNTEPVRPVFDVPLTRCYCPHRLRGRRVSELGVAVLEGRRRSCRYAVPPPSSRADFLTAATNATAVELVAASIEPLTRLSRPVGPPALYRQQPIEQSGQATLICPTSSSRSACAQNCTGHSEAALPLCPHRASPASSPRPRVVSLSPCWTSSPARLH